MAKEFLQRHLDGRFRKLFREITGLELHLIWHEQLADRKSGKELRMCPRVSRQATDDPVPRGPCLACLEQHWEASAPGVHPGIRFVGSCGLSTFRAAVMTVEGQPPLTLAVQARVRGRSRPGAGIASHEVFEKATALIRLIKHDLEMALRAEMAELALARLRRRLPVLRKEEQLLRTLERQGDPTTPAVGSNQGGHKQRVVQRMVSYVHEHFHHPMTLSDVAAELGMNAAYLSHLFSKQLGMTFHAYLVEVRMARARQLLLAPHRRIAEVACAVGYSSADQFRHAFKAHSGVSPSDWR